MTKKIEVELSENGINRLINQLYKFEKGLLNTQAKVIDDLAQNSVKKMEEVYSKSPVQDSTTMLFEVKGEPLKKEAIMYGYQALYDEFGTGTKGQENPHPTKQDFNLSPYNSGKTIRVNKSVNSQASKNNIPVGELYWTYTDVNGKKQYTQGIAAQKEGYIALQDTKKKMNNIIKKRITEALNDFG